MAAGKDDLHELLITDGEQQPIHIPFLARHKKLVAGLLAVVACAAVAGIVVGSVAASHGLPAQQSSSSSSSLQETDNSNLEARPSFSGPIAGLSSAQEPTVYRTTANTQSAEFSYRHYSVTSTGTISHTRLEYNVTKKINSHCPSQDLSVLAIQCNADSLRFAFTDSGAAAKYGARWGANTVVFIRHEWGCGTAHVREFAEAPMQTGRYLRVRTLNASIASAFEHANITFFTNYTDDSGPTVLRAPTANSAPAHHRRDVWTDIGNVFSDVSAAIPDLTQLAVTGDLDVSMQPFSAQYALQPYTVNAGDSNNGASATFGASFTFNTNVNLQIQDYAVSSFTGSVTASVTPTMTASVYASESYSSSNTQPLIDTTTLASGTIDVFGVPIPVNLLFTVYGGYSVSAAASGSISATATATATGTGTVTYTPDGGVQPWANGDLTGSVQVGQPQINVQANAVVYVVPAVYLQTAYIGGPVAYFSAYGTAALPDQSCTVSEAAGVEVDVGAQISIDIPDITQYQWSSSPYPVYGPSTLWTDSQTFC